MWVRTYEQFAVLGNNRSFFLFYACARAWDMLEYAFIVHSYAPLVMIDFNFSHNNKL